MKNNEAFEVLQIIFPRGYDLDARLVEAVQKHLKQSQQQLLERLRRGGEGMRFEDDLRTSERNEAIDDFLALIQEEKSKL